ncbi:hypothetical protein LX69_00399 [Breznakibacter xylanolyticus]|uniref:Uncharacterized protein n=1 Tax=Breznakibacter xylanolyticus TaxID=990 RepID=A0A2W7NIW8_9BACT|nr:hypothetical protein LX69_00399 [Breznakibacter xylanolyticus]
MKAAETEKELSGQPDPILRFSSRKLRTNVVAGLLTLPALAPSQINGDSVACVAKVFFAIGEQDYSSGYCPGFSPGSLANRFRAKQFYHNGGKDRNRWWSYKKGAQPFIELFLRKRKAFDQRNIYQKR